ncbi:MAG TPA: GatB/YqeY domain-containing protein [Candidatus Limnocylindrales bacterium]|nr:GatB/YqeY domain-containing protein [Candidatus Limnocylindrales bacterium]
MTLRDRLDAEVTAAMRSGDALRRDTLRMAKNAIYNAEKRDRRAYAEDELAVILAKEVKTRRESIEAFEAGGRPELAAKEAAEIEILSEFLPQALTPAELDALVAEAIAATGAASPRDMGKVMGWLSPRTRGRADGRALSGLVTAALAQAAPAAETRAPGAVER